MGVEVDVDAKGGTSGVSSPCGNKVEPCDSESGEDNVSDRVMLRSTATVLGSGFGTRVEEYKVGKESGSKCVFGKERLLNCSSND